MVCVHRLQVDIVTLNFCDPSLVFLLPRRIHLPSYILAHQFALPQQLGSLPQVSAFTTFLLLVTDAICH